MQAPALDFLDRAQVEFDSWPKSKSRDIFVEPKKSHIVERTAVVATVAAAEVAVLFFTSAPLPTNM